MDGSINGDLNVTGDIIGAGGLTVDGGISANTITATKIRQQKNYY